MMRVREWLRAWLFREETSQLKTLMFQVDNLRETTQLAVEQSTQALTQLGRLHLAMDRLEMLLAPQAPRLRAGKPVIVDWDEVQRKNLQQLEEDNHGKPIRR